MVHGVDVERMVGRPSATLVVCMVHRWCSLLLRLLHQYNRLRPRRKPLVVVVVMVVVHLRMLGHGSSRVHNSCRWLRVRSWGLGGVLGRNVVGMLGGHALL